MTTDNQQTWITKEIEQMEVRTEKVFDKKPPLIIAENQLADIEVDFSKEWDKYEDKVHGGIVKKIIPVKHEGVDKNFWLNTKNPLYRELLNAGSKGITKFRVMRTGQAKATKYILVK